MKYAELRVAYKDAKNLVARYKEDVRMLQQQVAECANDIATAKTLQAENKRLKRELDKPVEDPRVSILEAENKRLKRELDKLKDQPVKTVVDKKMVDELAALRRRVRYYEQMQ